MNSYVKTTCQHCSGAIEFDASQMDSQELLIECPHCHSHTKILAPRAPMTLPPPVIQQKSTPFPFRQVLMWGIIVWTVFCALGLFLAVLNIMWGETQQPVLTSSNKYEATGAFLGFSLGMLIWFGVWAIFAIPAALIWLITKKEK